MVYFCSIWERLGQTPLSLAGPLAHSRRRHQDMVEYSEVADSVHARTWSQKDGWNCPADSLRYYSDEPYYTDWLTRMLLLLLRKKQSSSFARSSMCSRDLCLSKLVSIFKQDDWWLGPLSKSPGMCEGGDRPLTGAKVGKLQRTSSQTFKYLILVKVPQFPLSTSRCGK